jgi:hypothetical protein
MDRKSKVKTASFNSNYKPEQSNNCSKAASRVAGGKALWFDCFTANRITDLMTVHETGTNRTMTKREIDGNLGDLGVGWKANIRTD